MTDGILTAVARAEHLRRQRLLTRFLLRVVPIVAAAVLVAAVAVRLARAPLAVFWASLAIAAAGLAIAVIVKRRVPAVDDAAAAQLDADAALGGELRSAHWFALHPAEDPWAAHHVRVAGGRVDDVSWPSVYPPVQAARTWAGSSFMVLAAVALALTSAWPARLGGATNGAATIASNAPKSPKTLPADLQKQIDDLIKAVQNGSMPMDAARAKVAQLRDAVADLDPKLQAALAEATKGKQPSDGNAEDPETKDLASKAQQAAASADLPQDMKWSLQDLAEKLANAGKKGPKQDSETGSASPDSSAKADAKSGDAGDKAQQAGVQMTRNAGADAQSNQMMATSSPLDGLMKVDPRGEDGGGRKGGAFKPFDMAAMKKETIQADTDTQGANVLADLRRKSEQSRSAMAFSRVAPLATYDKSHATAPPPPPDSLRSLVKQYFIRK